MVVCQNSLVKTCPILMPGHSSASVWSDGAPNKAVPGAGAHSCLPSYLLVSQLSAYLEVQEVLL